ncbi:hypothetical protein GDO86_011499, partial [Hymenochirus boettgeri]
MFKKLKQKITEEQSPLRSSPGQQQQQGHPRGTTGNRSRGSSVTEHQDDNLVTPDREKNEPPSFAQKLQLRVPSMESLFRSPNKDTTFQFSSKDSLWRSGSRDSLNKMDIEGPGPVFDPSSDIESETEESMGSTEGLDKEQLYNRLHRMEKSLGSYRGKYSELVTAYRTLQRDKDKLQSIMSQSQDKALRRIGELREELKMDQQAKKHLQEEFDASLEEKDQFISVLQTQVNILKQRLGSGQDISGVPEFTASLEPYSESSLQEGENDNSTPDTEENTAHSLNALQVRVKRQENLLQRCKKIIKSHKEQSAQLTSEKEALQNQLDERLQELEKIKELHTSEKTKLINQLRDAKNLVEQLEQDKGMVIAETKRQMHETLEVKEEEISDLRFKVKKLTTQCEELQGQNELFQQTEMEKTNESRKTENDHKKLRMEEQIKAIEQASEEERLNLQKELSRVKQEVVDIMKKSCDSRISEIEKSHAAALLKKEQDYNEILCIKEQEFQDHLKAKSHEESINKLPEKEKNLIAIEEFELQKTTIESNAAEHLKEKQLEIEVFRTKILELEHCIAKYAQENENLSKEFAKEKASHNAEIADISEKYKQEIYLVQEQEKMLSEKLEVLKQANDVNLTELKEKYQQDFNAQLMAKEHSFQEHIQQMNEKTLEKLDIKQTELEALSAELSEAQKSRQEIKQKLLDAENKIANIKKECEALIKAEQTIHSEEIVRIEKEKEILTQGVEKDFKEKINNMKLILDSKEMELHELSAEKQRMNEACIKIEADYKEVCKTLEALQYSQQINTKEKEEASEIQQKELQEKINSIMEERDNFKVLGETKETELRILGEELESYKNQLQNLTLQMEEQSKNMTEKLTIIKTECEAQIESWKKEITEKNRIALEKEKEDLKVKEYHNQLILELNSNLLEKEKKIASLQQEHATKNKNYESKLEKLKQKLKEQHETSRNKYAQMENKLRNEIEKKQNELIDKEKAFNERMSDMAHASSSGISDALSKLELNHKEQIQNFTESHQKKLSELELSWKKKINQSNEELKEKYEEELQGKDQIIADTKTQFTNLIQEKEEADKQLVELKEVKRRLDDSLNALQEQLHQSSIQVLSLTESKSDIKVQYERLEKDCDYLKNEKEMLQQQLHDLKTLADENQGKIIEFISKIKFAEDRYIELERIRSKESTEFAKLLQDKLNEKEENFRHILSEQEKQLISCCRNAEDLFESITSGLQKKCNEQINRFMFRITNIENCAHNLKKTKLKQHSKIYALEEQLELLSKKHALVNISLSEMTLHLQEKENSVLALKQELDSLNFQYDMLKKGGSQQKDADERESCITQLKKELSENINIVTSLKATINDKDSELSSLSALINELKHKSENCVALAEKESAISDLTTQHKEREKHLQNLVQDLTSNIQVLNKEKASCLDEAEKLKNTFDEWKKNAELKFVQNNNIMKELRDKVEMSKKEMSEKDERLKIVMEEIDHHRSNTEKTQELSESKEFDLATQLDAQKSRISELEEQCAKLISENKGLTDQIEVQNNQESKKMKELIEKLQHVQCASDSYAVETQEKCVSLEKEIDALKEDLDSRQTKWQLEKTELCQCKDIELKSLEEKLTAESANKLLELKKKAEQKIASIRKQLVSQLDDKEQAKKDLENQMQKGSGKSNVCLNENMQKERIVLKDGFQQELEKQKDIYLSLLEQIKTQTHHLANIRNEVKSKDQKIVELESIVKELKMKNNEKEQTEIENNQTVLLELHTQKLANEQLASKLQEEFQALQDEIKIKDAEVDAFKQEVEFKAKSLNELQVIYEETQSQENALRKKIEEAESENKNYERSILNSKRYAHFTKGTQPELDLLKKELTEESEQNKQEDMELKHNSTLKQLMREFNTQIGQKEREVETAVQETIAKAQEVEAELMRSHQIEAAHLHKKIAEKEDDLKRTVKKYEELLETREDEMTEKVTELQAQVEKLKAMLSEKESDAENGQVHTLEDQVKNFKQGVFYTPLGTPYKDDNNQHSDVSVFGEPTEFEYLRKVMFEYMMGRETK